MTREALTEVIEADFAEKYFKNSHWCTWLAEQKYYLTVGLHQYIGWPIYLADTDISVLVN